MVEIVGSPAGGYCAKLLADLGAEVTLAGIERADTDLAGFVDADKVVSTRPVTELAAGADVVIESSAPGPLVPARLAEDPRRVTVRLSPFGSSGPASEMRSTPLTDQARAGHLLLNGDPAREPIAGPPHLVAHAVGTMGAIGALAALHARARSGVGQLVEVSHLEVLAALHQFTLLRYTHNGNILTRMGNRYAGPGPVALYQCADGPISLVLARDDQLERLLAVTGLLHLLDEPGIAVAYDLFHHPTLLDDHLVPWFASRRRADVVAELQAVRVAVGPVLTPLEVLDDPHLEARGFWRGSGTVRLPGSPVRITPWESEARPRAAPTGTADGPLTGVTVLDLSRVWAGPLAGRILADLGAEVVTVEAPFNRGGPTVEAASVTSTHYYPDDVGGERHWNRIGFFNKYAINKRSLAVDLTDPRGLDALERLVRVSDVLIENYAPRVMPQLGLAEDHLAALNPGLVYVTMPGYGRSGPAADHVAYGPVLDGHAGLSATMGYADASPWKGGIAWPDPVAGMHAVAGALAALLAGGGASVEVAQLEGAVTVVGAAIVAAQRTGQDPLPAANRDPGHAPQGVYRCAGADRWVAISVCDEPGWAALCALAGLGDDLAPLDCDGRRAHHDEIDLRITEWTAPRDPATVARELQAVGVAAAVVADAADVVADDQLAARNAFVTIDHPEAGPHPWPRLPIALSATPSTYRRAAPCLGEHNREILEAIAGLDAATVDALAERGVIVDAPPG